MLSNKTAGRDLSRLCTRHVGNYVEAKRGRSGPGGAATYYVYMYVCVRMQSVLVCTYVYILYVRV